MIRPILSAALVASTLFSVSIASAHEGAEGVVKERMELMKTIGKNTKRIAPIAMGSADMDLKAVEESATEIANAAKMAIHKFPKGSTSMVSEAKENIWTDWEKFEGLMKSLTADAEALAELAKKGEEFELGDGFGKMASNCKKCHTDFRQKKEEQ